MILVIHTMILMYHGIITMKVRYLGEEGRYTILYPFPSGVVLLYTIYIAHLKYITLDPPPPPPHPKISNVT